MSENAIPDDIAAILSIVISRLESHIPEIEIRNALDGQSVIAVNPTTKKFFQLLYVFTPEKDMSRGYRVYTLEAVPSMLRVLIDPNPLTNGEKVH